MDLVVGMDYVVRCDIYSPVRAAFTLNFPSSKHRGPKHWGCQYVLRYIRLSSQIQPEFVSITSGNGQVQMLI
jgi:hypothetical protein